MSRNLQHYYLQQMGIEPWILREKPNKLLSNHASEGSTQPVVGPEKIAVDTNLLANLAKQVSSCTRCPLAQTRTQTVFARGNPQAKLMIVGEAPGFYEDQQGKPFVGKAGGLLNRMLRSIGLSDEDVYIANVLKCRPPNNRDPNSEEISQCCDYLAQQIAIVSPHLILAVGRFAGQFLLKTAYPLNKMRGTIHDYQGKRVLVSYHPAYLLRNPGDKKKAYHDLLSVKKLLAN
jgi:DNA polymerase